MNLRDSQAFWRARRIAKKGLVTRLLINTLNLLDDSEHDKAWSSARGDGDLVGDTNDGPIGNRCNKVRFSRAIRGVPIRRAPERQEN